MTIGAVDALVLEHASDSTIEFIYLLGDTGSWLGAVMVAIFALVVPLVKIVLLVLGEFWRCSKDPRRIQVARMCIRFVQIISKWACPDIIAYIFLFLSSSSFEPAADQRALFLGCGFHLLHALLLGLHDQLAWGPLTGAE